MTKLIGNAGSSSPKEEFQAPKDEFQIDNQAFRETLETLKLKLHDFRGNLSYGGGNLSYGERTQNSWGPSRYLIGNDDSDDNSESNYSFRSYTEDDEEYGMTQMLIKCRFCECDINVTALRHHLEAKNAYDPKNMVCPYCEKNLGEEATRGMRNSVPRKSNWRLYSSGSSFDPRPPSLDVQARSSFSTDFQSDEEDTISTANSDISLNVNATSIGTDAVEYSVDDEQDREEKSLRASFGQELVISTLISE